MIDPHLTDWESFYVIVGSSAAALTGLQFVVIALVADRGLRSPAATSTFSTPNVVHLTAVLGLSAVQSAPWHSLALPLVTISVVGVAGCAYVISVVRAAKRQHEYKPVLEDKVFHWWLPFLAYATLAVCLAFRGHVDQLLFGIGFVALMLLLIGIHNAWDAAVYITQFGRSDGSGGEPSMSEDTGD